MVYISDTIVIFVVFRGTHKKLGRRTIYFNNVKYIVCHRDGKRLPTFTGPKKMFCTLKLPIVKFLIFYCTNSVFTSHRL